MPTSRSWSRWLKFAGYTTPARTAPPSCRVLAGRRIYDDLLSELVPAGRVDQGRRHRERGHRDGTAGVRRAARPRERVRRPRPRVRGREVLTGGETIDRPGLLLQADGRRRTSKQDAEIIQREVFGPVVTVQRFDDEDAGAGVGQRRRLRAGLVGVDAGRRPRACAWPAGCSSATVWINTHIPITPEMPHGGYKQSGYGKDMSIYSHRGVHEHQARDGVARLTDAVGRRASAPGRAGGARHETTRRVMR